MIDDLRNSIVKLLEESSSFNSNDLLVHAPDDHSKIFQANNSLQYSLEVFPKVILRDAQKTKKESGVNSLCLTAGVALLTVQNKEVSTPIVLTPLLEKRNKIDRQITFVPVDDDSFINPFLLSHLKGLDVDITDISNLSEQEAPLLDTVVDRLRSVGIEVTSATNRYIGNFHHHRFQVIKELEELIAQNEYTENLYSLFGFDSTTTQETIPLPAEKLFASDVDHEAVFEGVKSANCVIQGPPGTGKSQVLSNLVAKLLAAEKTSVFVSEKRAALEVIVKKLSAFDLDKLCFISTSDNLSHSFLQELKKTWDYYEAYTPTPVNNVLVSEQYLDNLQMTLDLLSKPDLIGGVSYHTFHEMSGDMDLGAYNYSSEVPDIQSYIDAKNIVELVYEKELQQVLGCLKSTTLMRHDFSNLDQSVNSWQEQLIELSELFSVETWTDLKRVMRQAAQCQVYENDLFKKYADIFRPNSRSQKRFLSLRKKLVKSKVEVERINQSRSQWKTVPSERETESLLSSIETGGYFARLKLKKRWTQLSHLPLKKAKIELATHLEEIGEINNYSQLIIKFCELGVDEPETEVPLIYQTLHMYSEDQWAALEEIPSELRVQLTEQHHSLNHLYHDLKSHFQFEQNTNLSSYLSALKTKFGELVANREKFQHLDNDFLKTFGRNKSLQMMNGELLNSHWVRFQEHFPAFSNFKVADLTDKINAVISSETQEAIIFAKSINNTQYATFSEYHELLNTPARKLSEEQKKLKVELRKGKAILIKEFGKTRSHPSLRELYNSEARKWIQLLKPIWLSNPTQLAKCFPMEQQLFDVAIFDEASQMPIQNALGAIHRSKRIVVAGDEHQMGPSSYFKSTNQEVSDLLHQANYHWTRFPLQHHYRSKHPDLISFSNKHFYEGQLSAYPSFNCDSPIHHHFVENGEFIDRKNVAEAKAIAKELESIVQLQESIGVVAFSEEQLNCIWEQLTAQCQDKLTEKLEANQGFFKALENVQGDECDHLFISFGYGQNEDKEFHMRFGPMNTINGRRRLNVLLTRATQSIHFFCSITSNDFKLSDNESINLLRQWISFAESYNEKLTPEFPFSLKPIQSESKLTFHRIQETLPLAKELVTLQQVLNNRGWDVCFT